MAGIRKTHRSKKLGRSLFLITAILVILAACIGTQGSAGALYQSTTVLPCSDASQIDKNKQVHLYILVDDSISANTITDTSGVFRKSILKQVLYYAVSYGWLTENQYSPFIDIFKYARDEHNGNIKGKYIDDNGNYADFYDAYINQVWPQGANNDSITVDNLNEVVQASVGSIRGIIVNDNGTLEDLPTVLKYIASIVPNVVFSSSQRSLVILITDGSLVKPGEGDSQEKDRLDKAEYAWAPTIPISVFSFSTVQNYSSLWKSEFIRPLVGVNDEDIYFHDQLIRNYQLSHRVWDGMQEIYNRLGWLEGTVRAGIIKKGEYESNPFPDLTETIRIASLQTDEELKFNNLLGSPIDFLRLWQEMNLDSNKPKLTRNGQGTTDVNFIYSCKGGTSTQTSTPTPTPVKTTQTSSINPPPTTPTPPSEKFKIKNVPGKIVEGWIISGGLAIAVLFFLLLYFNSGGKSPGYLTSLSILLPDGVLFFGLISYYVTYPFIVNIISTAAYGFIVAFCALVAGVLPKTIHLMNSKYESKKKGTVSEDTPLPKSKQVLEESTDNEHQQEEENINRAAEVPSKDGQKQQEKQIEDTLKNQFWISFLENRICYSIIVALFVFLLSINLLVFLWDILK